MSYLPHQVSPVSGCPDVVMCTLDAELNGSYIQTTENNVCDTTIFTENNVCDATFFGTQDTWTTSMSTNDVYSVERCDVSADSRDADVVCDSPNVNQCDVSVMVADEHSRACVILMWNL
jgi:hypothetical protein